MKDVSYYTQFQKEVVLTSLSRNKLCIGVDRLQAVNICGEKATVDTFLHT